MSTESVTLQSQPFSSAVDLAFWRHLGTKKLEDFRLSSDPCPILGSYTFSTHAQVPSQLCLGESSFDVDAKQPFGYFPAPGSLVNVNTMEDFHKLDKTALMNEAGLQIWNDIQNGNALKNPALLNRFILLSFANLKDHQYSYWFGFPALLPPSFQASLASRTNLSACLQQEQVLQLLGSYSSRADLSEAGCLLLSLASPSTSNGGQAGSASSVAVHGLSEWQDIKQRAPDSQVWLLLMDPCGLPDHPGWPIRNALVLAAAKFGLRSVRVACLRRVPAPQHHQRDAKSFADSCPVFDVSLDYDSDQLSACGGLGDQSPSDDFKAALRVVGLERNTKGALAPRSVSLVKFLSPNKLAESSAELNLQLMRWRMLPGLDIDTLRSTKALLLGSGTLGCNVARALLGWGIYHITFVDSGNVSYSNPVRQSLFSFADCLDGGKPKAQAAAESLKLIYPSVTSEGHKLRIPMPGHAVAPSELSEVEASVKKLVDLIDSHDVVFLLTDSRESRWLPTLLCKAKSKLCLNAALGFDSFVVMRHGVASTESKSDDDSTTDSLQQLGCYFCNDVVAPSDSLRARTLDQQCTVTRPGLSMMASALAVELAAVTLHHKSRQFAGVSGQDEDCAGLGMLPHQIRGFLSSFQLNVVVGHAFPQCTACSETVLNEYRSKGFDFILEVLNQPLCLERLTGLDKLHATAETAVVDWDLDDF